jgi:thiamine kinase-like enzyme
VIEGVVARVWPEGVDSVERLGGGITNHNFKVIVDGAPFALRVGGKDTDLLGIDRAVEHEATQAAAALGLGPEVVAFVEPWGYLVTAFVEGETAEAGSVTAAEAASLLRRLHAAPAIPGRFDAFRVVEAYADTARAAGVTLPAGYDAAQAIAERIERRRGRVELRPCHNDLLPANFIRGRDRLWIVDWEYAGMGDPAFDLANFAVNHGLDEDGDLELLESYGDADPDLHTLMRFMSDFREAMWGVVQQAVSCLEFDFAGYAGAHFARLEQTAGELRFRRALG